MRKCWRRTVLLFVAGGAAMGAACGGDGGPSATARSTGGANAIGGTGTRGGTGGCEPGTESCSCFPNQTCFAGLACWSKVCVNPGTGGSAGTAGTAQGGSLAGGSPSAGGTRIGGQATGGIPGGGTSNGGTPGGSSAGGVFTGGSAPGGQSCALTATQSLVDTAAGTLSATLADGTVYTCAPSCVAIVPCGSQITLTAMAKPGSAFLGWIDASGSCAGTSSPCSAKVAAPSQTVIANFSPYNVAFVTSGTFSPNLGGTAGAHKTCQTLASQAGFGAADSFVAFLSTDASNAIDLLPTAAQGWVRPDGLPFADTRANLQNGLIWYPLVITETKSLATPLGSQVFTGSRPNASAYTGYNCNGWTSATSAFQVGVGALGAGAGNWLTWGSGDCTQVPAARLYCFGTKYSVPLAPPPPTPGRRAFLSATTFAPGAGKSIATADAVCQGDAVAAGLCPDATECPFKALLAQTGTTAKSRFVNQDGAIPVVRLDNVKVADSATDFWLGNLIAPIAVHSDGTPSRQSERLYTGATLPTTAGTAASTCNNWSDSAASSGAMFGLPMMGPNWFNWTNLFGCTGALGLYCLEDVP